MKLKLLPLLLVFSCILNAQEPYRHLMITEACLMNPYLSYVELTNMGDKTINLSEFKFGTLGLDHAPILDLYNDPWGPGQVSQTFFLPDVNLEPGQTYVITAAFDFGPRQYAKRPPGIGANPSAKQQQYYEVADLLIHMPEEHGDDTDSVTTTPYHYSALEHWGGRTNYFIAHHFGENDSVAIDQFSGVFDNNGRNFNQEYDVAGVLNATGNSIFVRKFKYKTGNLDFANARGLGDDDSEWIVITYPSGFHSWDNGNQTFRDLWWVTGNHGNYVLDENTLESDVIDVDYANKKLTVPWGIRRLDDIMRYMEKKPGIAWQYHLNDNPEDSLYRSARTGDKLEIIVCGDEKTTAVFDIVVSPPASDANIVVPVDYKTLRAPGTAGPITTRSQSGRLSWPWVTKNSNGVDTISGFNHGLPYALRTDSLLKRLEKPSSASWEFVWVDGITRPDIKDGDKLKVTAQNGAVKEYLLEVQPYSPNHTALLSAITWPDVPENLKGIFGWKGDTIPGFAGSTYNYRLEVPLEADGIPALVAKAASLNTKIDVVRATSLTGGPEDRTISFIVTAEDDSVQNIYNIVLIKEKDPNKIQPFYGEPFVSERVWQEDYRNNYIEIFNPGNQPLDLSNYIITTQFGLELSSHITQQSAAENFPTRYRKYVPGYKWPDETQWQVSPGVLEPDLGVNPILMPGEVFTIGHIRRTDGTIRTDGYVHPPYPAIQKQGINFSLLPGDPVLDALNLQNPWNENINFDQSLLTNPHGFTLMIFKILNDSVKSGLKPATDPNDFQIVEMVGSLSGRWTIGDTQFDTQTSWRRIPEVYKPNPVAEASFGTGWEDAEWVQWNANDWLAWGFPWGHWKKGVVQDIGKHYMIEPTHYKSTVSSTVYKVSDGYSMNEEIRGITTGTTVQQFLGSIIKMNDNQVLTVKAKADESVLELDAVLTNEDMLLVMSADSTNFSQYVLEVTDEGLSDNALLNSTLYEIMVDVQPVIEEESVVAGSGTVSGFEYGTRLKTILNNITVPAGASLSVINSSGAYVPTQMLNFDTVYVDVTVNSGIYLDVLAEDGLTRIVYQLVPLSSENDAFILSDIYTITQSTNLIKFVPRGTNVQTFLSYLVPAKDATVKLVDKMGIERTDGTIYQDDKVVVTSANGLVSRVYHLSMLRTDYILDSNYLAYILSNRYSVNQVDYKVAGPTGSTLVTEFISNVTPAMGATVEVVDADGNEKTTADLNQGDRVKVTSADGKMVVMYQIDFATLAGKPAEGGIQVYPNPTSGIVNIRGLGNDVRIQIFNPLGALIRDKKSGSSIETLSIADQPSGLYLVVLTRDSRLLGQYKVIRR